MFGISLLKSYSVSHRGDLKGKIVKKEKKRKESGTNIGEYLLRDPGKGLFKGLNQHQMKMKQYFSDNCFSDQRNCFSDHRASDHLLL